MITQSAIPILPLNLREMIGSPELEFFDNPTGTLLYPHLPPNVYDAVFDFGCGCGRIARLLMQQKEHRPRYYVGIDVHRELIGWCIENLAPIASNFQFIHHDVWSPSYGRGNSPRLAEPFPVEDGAFTLCIANSVFIQQFPEARKS
jgi:SAM-dependent methyltransferase